MTYTTEQLVESELGEQYDETTNPSSSTIANWIAEVDAIIDAYLGTSFTVNTATDEYHDYTDFQDYFVTDKRPLIGITTLEYNANSLGETVNWTSLTEGYENDFLVYPNQSRVKIHSLNYSIPYGYKNLKVTYTWGRSSVPKNVQYLATLMVVERILDQQKKSFQSKSPFDMSIGEVQISQRHASVVGSKKVFMQEIKELYGAEGKVKVNLDMWND